MNWYIIKKKSKKRWIAYKLDALPELKRGYEAKGPYNNFIQCMLAANGDEKLIHKKRQQKETL